MNYFICLLYFFIIILDIYEGNLKSILTLFFNVSRYKQSIKQQKLINNKKINPSLKRIQHYPSIGLGSAIKNPFGFGVGSIDVQQQFNNFSGYSSDPGTSSLSNINTNNRLNYLQQQHQQLNCSSNSNSNNNNNDSSATSSLISLINPSICSINQQSQQSIELISGSSASSSITSLVSLPTSISFSGIIAETVSPSTAMISRFVFVILILVLDRSSE